MSFGPRSLHPNPPLKRPTEFVGAMQFVVAVMGAVMGAVIGAVIGAVMGAVMGQERRALRSP